MFPTIFSLASEGLGQRAARVRDHLHGNRGGAVVPLITGRIAGLDRLAVCPHGARRLLRWNPELRNLCAPAGRGGEWLMRACKSCTAPRGSAALLLTLGWAASRRRRHRPLTTRSAGSALQGSSSSPFKRSAFTTDGKEFVDAVPKTAPEEILAQYHALRPASPRSLRAFVAAHFILPTEVVPGPAASSLAPIALHIDALWAELTRSTPSAPPYASLLALARPYVVPGGRFSRAVLLDSYFTMLGLLEEERRLRAVRYRCASRSEHVQR